MLLREGEAAPYTGDLYPVDVSVRFALEVEGCQERADAALDHARKIAEIELAKTRSLAQASTEASQQRIALLDAQLDDAQAWYRSTPFVATVAVVSTVAILLTSTVLVQATGEVRR